jgi:ubiquinone/menaquinone biosynthesis C-methylase UbiE
MNPVDRYWTEHTVRSEPFTSDAKSLAYLDWRSSQYLLFHDLMGLWGDHSDDVVLDYGCGPANDMVGFLVHGQARKVIGVDVSPTALQLARTRLKLHDIDSTRYRLVKVSDEEPVLPLKDASVDHIYSQGVLHHVSHPAEILAEFHRVLRPGGTAAVMVYARDSIWLHLQVAYLHQIISGLDTDLTVEQAFSKHADGGAPIARIYRPAEFLSLCTSAGFRAEYRGGYLAHSEVSRWRNYGRAAMLDHRLAEEHRLWLRQLYEVNRLPYHDSLPAGLGGVYWLTK